MPKLVDFTCEKCGAMREGFETEKPKCECGEKMRIVPWKNNASRWRHRD
jgi:hypothetical protein